MVSSYPILLGCRNACVFPPWEQCDHMFALTLVTVSALTTAPQNAALESLVYITGLFVTNEW